MTPQTSGKACLGARVGLREVDSVPEELQDLAGTIARSFGRPDPAAHDVLLDGGAPLNCLALSAEGGDATKWAFRERRPQTVHGSAW
jgi:hypothetical protein